MDTRTLVERAVGTRMSDCERSGLGVIDDGTLPTESEFLALCVCGKLVTVTNGRIEVHRPDDAADTVTVENSPTLAVHAEAAKFGYTLSSTEAAYIAEAAIAASGLRPEPHSGTETR